MWHLDISKCLCWPVILNNNDDNNNNNNNNNINININISNIIDTLSVVYYSLTCHT